ncbi:hypothetical protein Tco_1006052 [Tanacetum coccineum]|uniref:Uncharacterized protein n=1 Tax=Tanacetum coccineum TaxID=301880 RepID=A0ABQ5FH67_9ASTR
MRLPGSNPTWSCWTYGNPFHSYENCPEEKENRKERVLETYDYRSQYDAYEYETYHTNYNIEMEDNTMYHGEYGDQYFHPSYESASFFNQIQRPTQQYYYQGQRQGDNQHFSFEEKYDKLISMIESNKEVNRRYEDSFAAHEASFAAIKTHVDRLLDQLNRDETYEPQGMTMLDFDDEDEEDEEFLALSLYEDKCPNLLEEVEVTHIDQTPSQMPQVLTNKVGMDGLSSTECKARVKVAFREDHYVVEKLNKNSHSKLTHIIQKQVHRKARVGVRNLSQFVCHEMKNYGEVSNYDKLIMVARKKSRVKQVRSASSRRKRKRRLQVSKHKHFFFLERQFVATWPLAQKV